MIRTCYRALDPSDLDHLRKSRGSWLRNVLTVSLPVSALIFGVVFLITKSFVVATLFSAALFLGSTISNLRFFRNVRRGMTNSQAVEVIDVQAQCAIDVEHLGSYGPAYCFFVGEGQAILVVGQWLLECEPFPAASFQIHRWSDTGKPIRISATGPAIECLPSPAKLKRNHHFRQVEIFPGTPETLQQDMDSAFKAAE